MAKCVYCGTETALHVGGIPVCPRCDKIDREDKPPKVKKYSLSSDTLPIDKPIGPF